MVNILYLKVETLKISKISYLLLVFTLLLFSSSFPLFVNYNNDKAAAGFPPVPENVVISINPGASDKSSQNPYNPSQVTVPVGTIVTWINNDQTITGPFKRPHTITSGDPEKGPSNIFYSHEMYFPGGKFTITFDKPGAYPYYDRNYPHMRGQVTVE